MRRKTWLIITACAMLIVIACDNNGEEKASQLLKQADADYQHGRYEIALSLLDSLKKTYPKAIEARHKSLIMRREISLCKAQEDLEETDKLLVEARQTYQQMQETVEKRREQLKATAQELEAVTLMKIKVDSLQAMFDAQCEVIKMIHRQQQKDSLSMN